MWFEWGWFGGRRGDDGVGIILKVDRDLWGYVVRLGCLVVNYEWFWFRIKVWFLVFLKV